MPSLSRCAMTQRMPRAMSSCFTRDRCPTFTSTRSISGARDLYFPSERNPFPAATVDVIIPCHMELSGLRMRSRPSLSFTRS